MEETVVGLCNHRTTINTHTSNRSGSPDRVAREQIVVLRCTEEAYDAQLHNHLVDKLLSLLLCECAVLKVALNVDIQECADTTERHGSTVLVLNRTEIAEVGPLHCLTSVCRRLGNVETVCSTHAFKLLQSLDLLRNLLAMAYDFLCKLLNIDTFEITLLLLNKVCCTIKSYTTIVTDDTSTTISVGQTGDDMSMARSLDVIIVSREYAFVVCLAIFCKDSLCCRIKIVAVRLQSLLHHADTALREDTTLQWHISLQTNHHLAILIYIAGTISVYTLRQLCLCVVNALLALHLEHL